MSYCQQFSIRERTKLLVDASHVLSSIAFYGSQTIIKSPPLIQLRQSIQELLFEAWNSDLAMELFQTNPIDLLRLLAFSLEDFDQSDDHFFGNCLDLSFYELAAQDRKTKSLCAILFPRNNTTSHILDTVLNWTIPVMRQNRPTVTRHLGDLQPSRASVLLIRTLYAFHTLNENLFRSECEGQLDLSQSSWPETSIAPFWPYSSSQNLQIEDKRCIIGYRCFFLHSKACVSRAWIAAEQTEPTNNNLDIQNACVSSLRDAHHKNNLATTVGESIDVESQCTSTSNLSSSAFI